MLKLRKFLSCTLALLLAVSMPLAALAEEYDLANGSISVNAKEDGQYVTQDNGVQDHKEEAETVITQTITEEAPSTTNTITITAEQDTTAQVTIQDVNIDTTSTGGAAITVEGSGDVVIELDGSNTVQSSKNHAGVEKNNGGNLTITNADEVTASDPGSLDATGGSRAAGIGGGNNQSASDITITGNAQVEATGGDYGAGIGGGLDKDGSNITITGNAQVEATSGTCGAGIGGGNNGKGSSITITGNAQVEATGVDRGAGIGGGWSGDGSSITIDGNAQVEATGGNNGAGIGGGYGGDGSDIAITGSSHVTAQGGIDGAGIGGGYNGEGSNIAIDGSAHVTAKGGEQASGIGGGQHGTGSSITIDGSAQVTAKGGEEASGIGGGGGGFGCGSNITITGSAQVEATGGVNGAGIGGGQDGNGSDIAIGGTAEVTAKGDLSGAGIGGGMFGTGSSITVSDNAQLKAQGGRDYTTQSLTQYGAGASIGNGGKQNTAGQEVTPDTDALNEGWIAEYTPAADMGKDIPNNLIYVNEEGTVTTSPENNTITITSAADPTCTEAGHEDGFTVDGTLVAVTIPALGHSFTNYVSDKNATYESDGTKTAKCDRCDATDTLPDPGSKLVKPAESVAVSPKPAAVVEYSGIDESAFWQEVARQIEAAGPGDTIEVNAGGICTIPYWVIDAAVEHGVALSIHWRCGEDFIIDRQPDQQLWVYSFTTLPQMLGK